MLVSQSLNPTTCPVLSLSASKGLSSYGPNLSSKFGGPAHPGEETSLFVISAWFKIQELGSLGLPVESSWIRFVRFGQFRSRGSEVIRFWAAQALCALGAPACDFPEELNRAVQAQKFPRGRPPALYGDGGPYPVTFFICVWQMYGDGGFPKLTHCPCFPRLFWGDGFPLKVDLPKKDALFFHVATRHLS